MTAFGFQYKHGDRPLDGYTIQRAAGRGGFGEVYYAISDSGREVALKAVMGYEQIELRGISQCMNLKSPHLVTVFDVKHNDQGRPFVIMEYVAGPSLRQLLDESPSGMGEQKAAFFLREIAKGLSFLHEGGIVHRDLKPANIFYENGYVKIGDYGLSKAISAGRGATQTVTVGTVHYMAPEIGEGRYDRGIDLYALGAVLYEMLTGRAPHIGSSAGEILMKHMTAEPDCTGISEPFCTVIKKAMAKDPAQRYQTAQEMVEAVFGSEHVQQSVSCFSPDELTMVANRVAAHAKAAVGTGSSGGLGSGPAVATKQLGGGDTPSDVWMRMGGWVDRCGNRIGGGVDRLAAMGLAGDDESPADDERAAEEDPLIRRHRRVLSVIIGGVIAVAAGLAGADRQGPVPPALFSGLAMLGATIGLLAARRRLLPKLNLENRLLERLAVGGAGVLAASLTTLPFLFDQHYAATWAALIPPLLLINWRAWTSSRRPARVRLGRVFWAAVMGLIFGGMFDGNSPVAMGIAAGVAMIAQIASPWRPTASAFRAGGRRGEFNQNPPAAVQGHRVPPSPPPQPIRTATPGPAGLTAIPAPARRVPTWLRFGWLGLCAPLIALGVVLLAWAGMDLRNDREQQTIAIASGVCTLLVALFSLSRSLVSRYNGIWSYFFKPFLMTLCIAVATASLIALPNTTRDHPEPALFAIFLLVCAPLIFVVIALIPSGGPRVKLKPTMDVEPEFPRSAESWRQWRSHGDDWRSQQQGPALPLPAPTPPVSLFEPKLKDFSVYRPARRTSLLFSMLGGLVLIVGLAVGGALAIDLPGMVAAGVPDRHLADELQRQVFGTAQWPVMARMLGVAVTVGLLAAASAVLIVARRRAGAAHMLRGAIGPLGLMFAIAALRKGLEHYHPWPQIAATADDQRVSVFVQNFANAPADKALVLAVVAFLVSVVFLAWPEPQPKPERPVPPSPLDLQIGLAETLHGAAAAKEA